MLQEGTNISSELISEGIMIGCYSRVSRNDPVSTASQGRSNIVLVEVVLSLQPESHKRQRLALSGVHDREPIKRSPRRLIRLTFAALSQYALRHAPSGGLELGSKVVASLGDRLHDGPKARFSVADQDYERLLSACAPDTHIKPDIYTP
jgi:hypothetical protein